VIKKYVPLLLLSLLLCSCNMFDSMTEGFAHSNAVAAALEKSLGAKPFVGFSWNNGSLTQVSVVFEGYPAGKTFADISGAASQSVLAEFKQKPGEIMIGFRLAQ
jgi:hypothetical protein